MTPGLIRRHTAAALQGVALSIGSSQRQLGRLSLKLQAHRYVHT